jgi:HlyD family secretion protein
MSSLSSLSTFKLLPSRKLMAAIVLTMAGAAGFYVLNPANPAPAIATTPEGPKPAAAPARVMALGRIEPVSEVVRIAAPAAQDGGRLAEILVREGDWVEPGAIIAILDTRPRLLAALQQSEATVILRRAGLTKLLADLESQEKTLLAALEQQEAQRDRAKWDLDRLQQLQKSGLYRDTALIDKRLALEGSNHVLDSARLTLERNRKRDASGERIDAASARADVMAAEAALARAKADLAFSEIRSPIAGRVLRRMGRLGEQISQEGFAEIADTRIMMVRAEVFESDLKRVSVGGLATITSRALDAPLSGTIERVGLKVNRQTIIGEDPAAALDARVIEVMIRLDEASSQRAERLTGLQVRVALSAAAGS